MKAALVLCTALLVCAGSASAADYKAGSLEIAGPWARATPKGATIAAGYAAIKNTGSVPDRLIGGSTEAGKRLEMHRMEMDQGVMKMRELKGGLEIPAGQTVELKPGGLHLMFVGLARPLQKGDSVRGTLVFERAGTVDIEYQVEAVGAAKGGAGPHAGH